MISLWPVIAVIGFLCLLRPSRNLLGVWALLHAIALLMELLLLHGTSWLAAWGALVTSAQGSLLLWATLTANLLTWTLRKDDGANLLYRRMAVLLLLLLWGVQLFSALPRFNLGTAYPWIWLVVHPMAIFTSYASQLLLLSAGIAAFWTGLRDNRSMGRLAKIALVGQVIGTLIGSWWAAHAWGQAWSWDPIECFSLAGIIWLACLYDSRHCSGDWLAWSSVLIPLYTIAATSLVRSGLLQASSVHGYLPETTISLAAIALGGFVALVFPILVRRQPTANCPRTLVNGLCMGSIHWLSGMAIALWPGYKQPAVTVIRLAWLGVFAWAMVRPLWKQAASGMTRFVQPMKKP